MTHVEISEGNYTFEMRVHTLKKKTHLRIFPDFFFPLRKTFCNVQNTGSKCEGFTFQIPEAHFKEGATPTHYHVFTCERDSKEYLIPAVGSASSSTFEGPQITSNSVSLFQHTFMGM